MLLYHRNKSLIHLTPSVGLVLGIVDARNRLSTAHSRSMGDVDNQQPDNLLLVVSRGLYNCSATVPVGRIIETGMIAVQVCARIERLLGEVVNVLNTDGKPRN
jgi:hypothetical protein